MIPTNELLKEAKKKLKEHQIDEREARLLLSFVLGCSKEELIKFKEVQDRVAIEYKMVIARRCSGIPYAYIVGHKEFMRLDFKVNENVLIPRDDTEVLTEKVIELAKKIQKTALNEIRIMDMCTGSGCIAIALAKNLKNAKILAIDKSKEALEVAKKNARLNDVEIEFIESDLFKKIEERFFDNEEKRFDIIVSNPPYIESSVIPKLQREVKDNEPLMALDGGEDGLSFYRRISVEAKKYLKKNGILAYEIGYDQANSVIEILKENGYQKIEVEKDYSGNDRVVIGIS